ncbi:hypothetical protein [Streptomyces sp. ISL-94]|nr:hypothetical protein [Streptomyces sp. ISL-94]MBT2481905.1 hypothetical protein [Streptomyces sp. ISL-94]
METHLLFAGAVLNIRHNRVISRLSPKRAKSSSQIEGCGEDHVMQR